VPRGKHSRASSGTAPCRWLAHNSSSLFPQSSRVNRAATGAHVAVPNVDGQHSQVLEHPTLCKPSGVGARRQRLGHLGEKVGGHRILQRRGGSGMDRVVVEAAGEGGRTAVNVDVTGKGASRRAGMRCVEPLAQEGHNSGTGHGAQLVSSAIRCSACACFVAGQE